MQGGPIKCYHFLNSYNFQNNKDFFFIFRNINKEALNFHLNVLKAILEKRLKIVEAYFESKSVIHTQRLFTIDFRGKISPTRLTVARLVQKFTEKGRVTNANKRHSARTAINIETVRQHLE